MDTDTPRFDNRLLHTLPGDPNPARAGAKCWRRLVARDADPVTAPTLLAWAPDVAEMLGFDTAEVESEGFAQVFGGNALYAACNRGQPTTVAIVWPLGRPARRRACDFAG